AELQLDIVVHQWWQLELLQTVTVPAQLEVWLKVDTGMHRLGIPLQSCAQAWQQLQACANVSDVRLMSHLACADERDHPLNISQLNGFAALMEATGARSGSLANSAGLLRGEHFQYQW